jgi:hypothetical protein
LIGANERKISEVAMMEFELDLIDLGKLARGVDAGDVVIDRNHMRTSQGKAHSVMAESNAKLQDLLALRRGHKAKRVVTRKIGSPRDGVEWKFGTARKRG